MSPVPAPPAVARPGAGAARSIGFGGSQDDEGVIRLTLPVPPSANRYWRHVGTRVVLSAAAKQYRVDVARVCITNGVQNLTGPIAVTYRWFRARKQGDLDNRTKQLLDALKGYAFADDKQVVELHSYRDDSEPQAARVVVTICPLET